MIDVVMPQMGESIVEGTLTKWLKKPGERVERDEPLFEISTDKVDTEIPSPAAGTLQEVLVEEGKTVGINTVVARIADEGGASRSACGRATAAAAAARSCSLRAAAAAPAGSRYRRQPEPPPQPATSGPEQPAAEADATNNSVRCRRWCARWRASTTSIFARCTAPAPAAASPRRMLKAYVPGWRRAPRRAAASSCSGPSAACTRLRLRSARACAAADASRRTGQDAHRADEQHAPEDRRAHDLLASAPRRTSPRFTRWT